RLNQADDVMLPKEAEPTVPNLYRRQEVPKVDPPVRVHLEAVSFRKVPQDAGHRPSEDLDLFVVQEEFALVPAMGTELLAEVTMSTTFLQHRPLLGCLVFAVGLCSFVLPVRVEIRLSDDAQSERLETFFDGPDLRFRKGFAVEVGEGRSVGPLECAFHQVGRPLSQGVRWDEVCEGDPLSEGEVRVARHVVAA